MDTAFFKLIESNDTLKALSVFFRAGNIDSVERDNLAQLEEYKKRYSTELNNEQYTPLYRDMWRSDLARVNVKISNITEKVPRQFLNLFITPEGYIHLEEHKSAPDEIVLGDSGVHYKRVEQIILLDSSKSYTIAVNVYREKETGE